MSYDPTQQVPPPQGYTPPPPYQQPPTYQVPQPPAPTYTQYSSTPIVAAPGAGFDFSTFWRSLGLSGQAAGLAGLVVIICFLLPWFSNPSDSYNGFTAASGSFSGTTLNLFPYLWLVLLGAVGLALNAWFISRRRLSASVTTITTIATSAVMLALEICFLTEVNSFFTISGSTNNGGIGAGFWLATIATAAALGVSIYTWTQGRKVANPYQQVAAQPYIDPYQPTPQYPAAPPYQYPNQPPQYPGQ